jgi:hypothetical protein
MHCGGRDTTITAIRSHDGNTVGIRKCSEESCGIRGDEADGLGRLSFIRLKTGIRLGLY